MFVVTEADAAAIRAAFEQRGELSAVVELRRLFPGVTDNQARECARTIAGWKPLPLRPVKRMPKVPRLRRSALTWVVAVMHHAKSALLMSGPAPSTLPPCQTAPRCGKIEVMQRDEGAAPEQPRRVDL